LVARSAYTELTPWMEQPRHEREVSMREGAMPEAAMRERAMREGRSVKVDP
jgi:hypothetical protein